MGRYSVQVRLESQKGDFPGINIPNHCDHTIQAKIMVTFDCQHFGNQILTTETKNLVSQLVISLLESVKKP